MREPTTSDHLLLLEDHLFSGRSLRTEAEIRKKRQQAIYDQQERRRKVLEIIAVILLILIIGGFAVGLIWLFLQTRGMI